jgi:hypothetical protein
VALLFFNVGVEIGQLAFVGVVLAVSAALLRVQMPVPAWGQALPSYAIGVVATHWSLERLAAIASRG